MSVYIALMHIDEMEERWQDFIRVVFRDYKVHIQRLMFDPWATVSQATIQRH